jgi:hypothetical protein
LSVSCAFFFVLPAQRACWHTLACSACSLTMSTPSSAHGSTGEICARPYEGDGGQAERRDIFFCCQQLLAAQAVPAEASGRSGLRCGRRPGSGMRVHAPALVNTTKARP